ncbi:hypothetical protein [Thiomicrorhabdus sp.]|uniref:hypothetical protein n=1 Tax=Thiomicrorhabdus sp. TaxID=2039724 RepID=UPI00356AF03D
MAEKIDLPQTYWKYRRSIAIACAVFGFIFALVILFTYDVLTLKEFPVVSFSTVVYLFLVIPIVIYMTGANREDLEKIKGILEVLKK